jgi:CubicO group peptidase (beta-lactamase class C family)
MHGRFGAEVDPREVGINPAKLEALYNLLEQQISDNWQPGLQLTVRRHGKIVFDVAMGIARREDNLPMRNDTLMMIFSATKPLTAMCIHLLAERGQLQLDDTVAKYWANFANNGKEKVTIRHVLTHKGGFPDQLGKSRYKTWDDAVKLMEDAELRFPAGEVLAYHPVNYGWVLGEVIQRVTDTPVADFMRQELFEPLQMHRSFLGLPPSEEANSSRFHGPTEEIDKGIRFWNRDYIRALPIPAATAWTTGYDLSRFYQMMLNKGELDGVRIVKPETVAQALSPSAIDEFDNSLMVKTRWAHGFSLGGHKRSSFGQYSSLNTFGHNGYQSTTAWADFDRAMVSCFFTNQVLGPEKSYQRDVIVNEAVSELLEPK